MEESTDKVKEDNTSNTYLFSKSSHWVTLLFIIIVILYFCFFLGMPIISHIIIDVLCCFCRDFLQWVFSVKISLPISLIKIDRIISRKRTHMLFQIFLELGLNFFVVLQNFLPILRIGLKLMLPCFDIKFPQLQRFFDPLSDGPKRSIVLEHFLFVKFVDYYRICGYIYRQGAGSLRMACITTSWHPGDYNWGFCGKFIRLLTCS